jgi:hypothetical protein
MKIDIDALRPRSDLLEPLCVRWSTNNDMLVAFWLFRRLHDVRSVDRQQSVTG